LLSKLIHNKNDTNKNALTTTIFLLLAQISMIHSIFNITTKRIIYTSNNILDQTKYN